MTAEPYRLYKKRLSTSPIIIVINKNSVAVKNLLSLHNLFLIQR